MLGVEVQMNRCSVTIPQAVEGTVDRNMEGTTVHDITLLRAPYPLCWTP